MSWCYPHPHPYPSVPCTQPSLFKLDLSLPKHERRGSADNETDWRSGVVTPARVKEVIAKFICSVTLPPVSEWGKAVTLWPLFKY